MIFFQSDYKNKNVIVDKTTKNKSFVKMARTLHLMGIENNLFMLTLYDKALQGVDPWSDNLTKEQKLRIMHECYVNPWYFFREVQRIPAQGGADIPFALNRANMALIWCHYADINSFLTMPRQIGKTVGVLSISNETLHVTGNRVEIAMFAKDAILRTDNVRRLKELRDTLPGYMVKKGSRYSNDNQESLNYIPLNNQYKTYVALPDAKRSERLGRGGSYIWMHWDEFAFFENNNLAYDSASAITDTAAQQARDVGIPCGNMITTTAGNTATAAGEYAYNFKNNALRFSEQFYDIEDREQLDKILTNSSVNRYLYLEFSHTQLGKDDKWLKQMTIGKSKEVVAMDYLNEWIHGGSESIVPEHLIRALTENIIDPISITVENDIVMHWYAEQSDLNKPENKNISYILGSDTSDNGGKDFTTLVMIDPRDMGVIMTMRCNQANLLNVVMLVFSIMTRFPNLIFIPERNRAAALLDVLIKFILEKTKWDPFKRIFNTYVQEMTGRSKPPNTLDLSLGTVRKHFGFNTTSAKDSRKTLYSKVINTTIERNYVRIFDKNIISEIKGLRIVKGRVDHGASGHDDTLIAYLIACWFIMFGNNLDYYGIDVNNILINDNVSMGNEDLSQLELRKRFEYLKKQLESPHVSDIMKLAYTREYNDIQRMITDTPIISPDTISVSQISNNDHMEHTTSQTIHRLKNMII